MDFFRAFGIALEFFPESSREKVPPRTVDSQIKALFCTIAITYHLLWVALHA
jgi:hypothetical protein